MARPKIIVKPKKIVSRKQRKLLKTENDYNYLLEDTKTIRIKSVDDLPLKHQGKKNEYPKRKKDRKKSREKRKLKQQRSKTKTIPTPVIDYGEYLPTIDIFEIIEDYIMTIPTYIETWKKGLKGHIIHGMQPFKMSLISLVRDYSMAEDKEVETYFKNNEYAIKECIDAFHAISTEDDLYTLEYRLVNIINMGHALSADTMNYLELLEN